ncbi:MAG: trypsin-like peptidase domain-containing protein [Planctomycetes bacterium]|nr:trypsin-like peptidase domain-containing protein [Planctomycetota bacterium]MCB9887178.1 trypsin-like peptidase domain-containing protein [Planctomycetota bacterium]
MGYRISRPVRVAAFGAVCLGAGVWAGTSLRSPARVWHGDEAGAAPGLAQPASFADVVARVGKGVVTVRSQLLAEDAAKPRVAAHATAQEAGSDAAEAVGGPRSWAEPVFEAGPGQRTGSGFVVDAKGLVVTSRHLVLGNREVQVQVPERGSFRAEVVGEDAATDLALVRLVAAPDDLVALALGPSEQLRAGDWIVAVGNPFGFAQTVTAGVVSYVGRHLHTDLGVTSDFLQFSAPVNPGSSGCPLFDGAGNVVGVTTQAATAAQGISFAVPSRSLKWALDAMVRAKDGKVRRGYLGIEFASRARPAKDEACPGAVITRVAIGEPAERAGLRRGDVVLSIDGEAIADASSLHDRILQGRPGARIRLQLLRDGRVWGPVEAELGEVGSLHSLSQPN